jgi:ATP phosphoribosyltransferase regulatory subunit HisZ
VLLKKLLSISASRIPAALAFLMLPLHSMAVELEYANRQMTQFQRAIEALNNISVQTLSLDAAPFCLRYTCREIISVKIPEPEWNDATKVLSEKPNSAQMERAILAEVVSRIEILMGRLTNTQYDIGGTFRAKSLSKLYSL